MASKPAKNVERGKSFYASLALDVSYFPAMWHSFSVGHLLSTDVDRIARRHGISMADLNLLGALGHEHPKRVRASDLVLTLQVSNAVLSARIAKLAEKRLLIRQPSQADRRVFELAATPEGTALVEAVLSDVEHNSSFVRHFNGLPEEDRIALARIMAELHGRMDRDFVPVRR